MRQLTDTILAKFYKHEILSRFLSINRDYHQAKSDLTATGIDYKKNPESLRPAREIRSTAINNIAGEFVVGTEITPNALNYRLGFKLQWPHDPGQLLRDAGLQELPLSEAVATPEKLAVLLKSLNPPSLAQAFKEHRISLLAKYTEHVANRDAALSANQTQAWQEFHSANTALISTFVGETGVDARKVLPLLQSEYALSLFKQKQIETQATGLPVGSRDEQIKTLTNYGLSKAQRIKEAVILAKKAVDIVVKQHPEISGLGCKMTRSSANYAERVTAIINCDDHVHLFSKELLQKNSGARPCTDVQIKRISPVLAEIQLAVEKAVRPLMGSRSYYSDDSRDNALHHYDDFKTAIKLARNADQPSLDDFVYDLSEIALVPELLDQRYALTANKTAVVEIHKLVDRNGLGIKAIIDLADKLRAMGYEGSEVATKLLELEKHETVREHVWAGTLTTKAAVDDVLNSVNKNLSAPVRRRL